MRNDDNNFFVSEVDEFDEADEIATIYPIGEPDNLFGLGRNRQKKKAEKKIAKAEKALAHGNVRKAERKLKKGTSILEKIQAGQQAAVGAKTQLQQVNQAQANLNTMSTNANESMQTEPGQIGLSAMPATTKSSLGDSGGGGGYEDGMTAMDTNTNTNPQSDEPTGKLAEEKSLENVTVTAKKKSDNSLMIIGILIVVIVAIVLYSKYAKK